MKIIIIDGKHKGYMDYEPQGDYSSDEVITFSKWECGPFPAKGYLVNYDYKLVCIINLGKPIAFYKKGTIQSNLDETMKIKYVKMQSQQNAQNGQYFNPLSSLGSLL